MSKLVVSYLIAVSLIVAGLAVAGDPEPAGSPAQTVAVTTISLMSAQKTIPVSVLAGDQFMITLDSNRTTGYQWRIASKLDEATVLFVSTNYNPPSEAVPGRGGSEAWMFRAIGKGKATIVLEYVRPWEENAKPAKTQTFNVSVL